MIGDIELLSPLLQAALLDSVIGFERETMNWAARLRTHMLVNVGAALVMLISAVGFTDVLGTKNVALDPSRVAAKVGSCIGFLGAGSTVMRSEIVRGLTTAAIESTVVIFIILAGVRPLERRFISVKQHRNITRWSTAVTSHWTAFMTLLGPGIFRVEPFIVQQSEDDPKLDDVHIELSRATHSEFSTIHIRLEAVSGLHQCQNGS